MQNKFYRNVMFRRFIKIRAIVIVIINKIMTGTL